MDTTKARRELGWEPRYDAQQTLREMVDAAREQGLLGLS
jgi:nucleoside-diphosphate-sugar epimerase